MELGHSDSSQWVTRPKPNPAARLRLFCFPFAGGGASAYRAWADFMPPEVELCLVQLPGREERLRQEPFSRIGPLVETLLPVLRPYLDRPFALYGHSMGAFISFEVARALRRQGEREPAALLVSAQRAPQLPDPIPSIHNLPDPEFMAALRGYGGTPEAVLQHAELMNLVLPLLRADFAVIETYEYAAEPPLACPISAFGGRQDNDTGRDQLSAWREQTTGSFLLRMYSGDHFFIRSAQPMFLQAMGQDLKKLN